MDEAGGRELLDRAHALLRAAGSRSRIDDDRRRQRPRARRRLRARDGLRRAARRVLGLVRPARDQPRDHPGLRRHAAAAAARRPGQGARDEHDRRPDLRRGGVRVRAREPGRGRPRAVRHGARLGAQVRRPGAARARADQARLARRATSTRASRPRRRRSRPSSPPRTRARASARSSASASRSSRARERRPRPPARRADPLGAAGRRAHRGGDLGPVRHPGLPLARHRAVGERRPDGGRPHRRLAARPGALLGVLRPALRAAARQASRTARTARWPSSRRAASSRR